VPDGVLQWPSRHLFLITGKSMSTSKNSVVETGLKFHQIKFEERVIPQVPIEIAPEEVHLWGFLLDGAGAAWPQAVLYLSKEEQERANRLLSERHRQQFAAAHAQLRVLLARYCGQHPQELAIQRSSDGKPFVVGERSIRFNLTHSHGRALIAVAKGREVGIDLEKIRPEVDAVKLAKRFLSAKDQAFVESGDPTGRHERFLQSWVAREAVFKAKGTGITFPLDRDHLELSNNGQEGHLLRNDGGSEGADILIRFLSLESDWVGAVAAEGAEWRVVSPALEDAELSVEVEP
jgi:4'-phosphopantetheinyl transferase